MVAMVDNESRSAGVWTFADDVRGWMLEHPDLAPTIARKDFKAVKRIERVHHRDLSFRRFFNDYEMRGQPVVITNITSISGPAWTRSHIKAACGKAVVRPLFPSKKKDETWAGLRPSAPISVSQFLEKLGKSKPGPNTPYMHDWAIPLHCPALLQNYTIPKYFSQDYLSRITDSVGGISGFFGAKERPYSTSWPSLFIGQEGSGSGLHVDSGDTHFVMYMIEGEKEFRLLDPKDRVVASEHRMGTHAFETDLFAPDFEKHPLLALATLYTATLRPGDLLFVPGGSAHQVVNHSPVISISTNFVDASNVKRTIRQSIDEYKFDLAKQLERLTQSKHLETSMDPRDTPWTLRFQ